MRRTDGAEGVGRWTPPPCLTWEEMISYSRFEMPAKARLHEKNCINMTRSFLQIARSAFTPLSDADYVAFNQVSAYARDSYESDGLIEGIQGEGNPSLSSGSIFSVKQRRMLLKRTAAHAH